MRSAAAAVAAGVVDAVVCVPPPQQSLRNPSGLIFSDPSSEDALRRILRNLSETIFSERRQPRRRKFSESEAASERTSSTILADFAAILAVPRRALCYTDLKTHVVSEYMNK